jgi:hypothetical protein
MKHLTGICLLICLLTITCVAQDFDNGRFSIPTGESVLVIFNFKDKPSFALEFAGKNFRPLKNDEANVMFALNDYLFQVLSLDVSSFCSAQEKDKLSPREVLLKHKSWELNYVSQVMNEQLSARGDFVSLPSKREALFWSFLLPEKLKADVRTQAFLSYSLGERVLVLSASVLQNQSTDTAKSLLIDSLGTLRVSTNPIKVLALADAMKKGQDWRKLLPPVL